MRAFQFHCANTLRQLANKTSGGFQHFYHPTIKVTAIQTTVTDTQCDFKKKSSTAPLRIIFVGRHGITVRYKGAMFLQLECAL